MKRFPSFRLAAAWQIATWLAGPGLLAQPPADVPQIIPDAGFHQMIDNGRSDKVEVDEQALAREKALSEVLNRQVGTLSPLFAAPVARWLEDGRVVLRFFDEDHGTYRRLQPAALRRYAEEKVFAGDLDVRDAIFRHFDRNADDRIDATERAAVREAMIVAEMAARLATMRGGSEWSIRPWSLMEHYKMVYVTRRPAETREAFSQRFAAVDHAVSAPALRAAILKEFDADKNGRIDALEMTVLEILIRRYVERYPGGTLWGHDRDQDGRIDEAEWLDARDQLHRVLPVGN